MLKARPFGNLYWITGLLDLRLICFWRRRGRERENRPQRQSKNLCVHVPIYRNPIYEQYRKIFLIGMNRRKIYCWHFFVGEPWRQIFYSFLIDFFASLVWKEMKNLCELSDVVDRVSGALTWSLIDFFFVKENAKSLQHDVTIYWFKSGLRKAFSVRWTFNRLQIFFWQALWWFIEMFRHNYYRNSRDLLCTTMLFGWLCLEEAWG